ncbi:MAG: helix-turn-helix domain-containing protein [bacterium]|nr:helix-turn-helix domain-containing protein [bacterium]
MSVENRTPDNPSAEWHVEFGKRLKEARERAGMKQNQVQEQLGYGSRSLSRWESGEADPGIEKVAHLARLYGVSVDWLVGGTTIERTIRPGMVLIDNQVLEMLEHLVANGKGLGDVPPSLLRKPGVNFAAIVPKDPEVVGAEAATPIEQRMRRAWERLGGKPYGGGAKGHGPSDGPFGGKS